MARTAYQTAKVLCKLSELNFGQGDDDPFRITWLQLRSLAAVPSLSDSFLKNINIALTEFGKTIVPMNNSLIIASEDDLDQYRLVPDRILEDFLPGSGSYIDDVDTELDDEDP